MNRDCASPVYFGQRQCEQCTANKAYYSYNGRYLCGVHSRKFTGKRATLPKDPDAPAKKQRLREEREERVLEIAKANKANEQRGRVKCAKFRMMRDPEYSDGYRNVFPNYKHQNRVDGFGCKSLSPKDLGPVKHGQPGLPAALSIENYHQFGKCFPCEVDSNGDPLPMFRQRRVAAYLDPIPHRHKFSPAQMKQQAQSGNKNIPLFSLHVDSAGKERRYTYVQSRYFYCHQYELLAKQTADYAQLRQWLADGINLQIVGYDGYPVTESLQTHYEDASRPFGHELVLYSLLTIEDSGQYPWNVFYRKHLHLYE